MARSNKVLLGFEDEAITDKYKSMVDYTTNKFGGKPDWPGECPTEVTCKLCGLNVPLILQIYAPLENLHHRTLYIFACINPNCWNQQGSWVCLRVQVPDTTSESYNTSVLNNGRVEIRDNPTATEWCSGGENWGEDEENGNTVIEDSTMWDARGLAALSLDDEDRNANASAASEGASGTVAAKATAIIEGEEGEVVCIDTPTTPQVNLVALLEEAAPLPQVPVSSLEFQASFISVYEEESFGGVLSNGGGAGEGSSGTIEDDEGGETYEKAIPPHGDKLTHALVQRLSWVPGQILRYGGPPLPLAPLPTRLPLCPSCCRATTPELQILPTLVSKLSLVGSPHETHLEFGTILLFSCKASCWDSRSTFREEHLIVQAERI